MRAIKGENPHKGTVMLGDNAYFSEDNLQAAKAKEMEVVIPDEQYRNRDEQLMEGKRRKGKERFDIRYFKYDKKEDYYIFPTAPNNRARICGYNVLQGNNVIYVKRPDKSEHPMDAVLRCT